MPYYPKLIGQHIYLSPCQAEDADHWTRWLNDLEVAIPLGDEAYQMITHASQVSDVEETIRDRHLVFTVVERHSDRPLGRTVLFNICQVDRRAMFGLFIGDRDSWGEGYGTEASALTLDYAFNLLNLNSVELGVFSFNQRAIATYKKLGFKEIGLRRQFRIIAGKKYDMLKMDILAEEFNSPYLKPLVERITGS